MKKIVISGGTDGIGRGLALASLRRGDSVIVIGLHAEKGMALHEAAKELSAGERFHFIRADLSLISENRRVIEEVKLRFSTLDALVLCARYFRSHRSETPEGFEDNFALFYLSRYVLSYGLVEWLERSPDPVIVNVAGPGAPMSLIRWDDMEFKRGYDGTTALMQGGKLNDLLGVSFADRHGSDKIRYVLVNPGSTSTGFSGEYDDETRPHIERMKKFGKPVAKSIKPIASIVDNPPDEPLSAFAEGKRISIQQAFFDKDAAKRLSGLTEKLLKRLI
ncbi:SDR family NAD(P)-dependent oxidoreductase [Paenibacillus sp. P26]|nr:SDR family NAD(P)-dependent oxidoreductase [Paenibacillus sp. P26]UUZ91021.1 SDR family NAD(P)-dependent oxidoreductase [Paenibacillus sp. P25]